MPQAAVLSLSFGGAYDVAVPALHTNESGVTQANAYLVAAENNMLSSPELAELLDECGHAARADGGGAFRSPGWRPFPMTLRKE